MSGLVIRYLRNFKMQKILLMLKYRPNYRIWSSKQLYSLLISTTDHHQATSQKYFDNLFPDIKLPWKKIYLTAHKVAANRHLRCFNFKIINNVLYLNKKLFLFGQTQSPLCSFCHTKSQATLLVFHKCLVNKIFLESTFLKQILTFLI